jgi:hypothetical protein
MSWKYLEHTFNGVTGSATSYDSSVTLLGSLFRQYPDGVAPLLPSVTRYSDLYTSSNIQAVPYSTDMDWVFVAESLTNLPTKRFAMYTFDRTSGIFNLVGSLRLEYRGGNITMEGFRISLDRYSTGTISGSNTSVSGTDTQWITYGMCQGNRIKIGTSDYLDTNYNWNVISSVDSDTGITLLFDGGTIPLGTPYVIEDLRIVTAVRSAIVANGGLYIGKGLRPEMFGLAGAEYQIKMTNTSDNLQANYWLTETFGTLTGAISMVMEPSSYSGVSLTSRNAYVVNQYAGGLTDIYKFDVRKPLTSFSSSATTDAFLYQTGKEWFFYAPTQTTNNAEIATVNHGQAKGIPSLYLIANRTIARVSLSNIIPLQNNWMEDSVQIYAPYYTALFSHDNSSVINTVYSPYLDKFVTVGGGSNRRMMAQEYWTQGGKTSDEMWYASTYMLYGNLSLLNKVPLVLSHGGANHYIDMVNGIAYIIQQTTTVSYQQIFSFPIGADASKAVQNYQYVTTPKILTPRSKRYQSIMWSSTKSRGTDPFEIPTSHLEIYYRTVGIDNNSGEWIRVPETRLLTDVSADQIQFQIRWKLLSPLGHFPVLYNIGLVYEQYENDEHYQQSLSHSSGANKQFVWRFKTAFESTVPKLYVHIFDAKTNVKLLTDDTSVSAYGVFEKSIDRCETWSAYDTADKGNETTYIRYTPTGFYSNLKSYATLTQQD